MKYAIKYLSMVLVNAMMIMTFILAPIPGVDNTSYAADSDTDEEVVDPDAAADCEKEEDREDGKPGIYKAGCEFNDDLAKSSLKDHYPDGYQGIIEQFIGAVFALIGIAAIYKPVAPALAECPMHIGGKVTFPIITAGSLAYLMGEIQANAEFKKGSKIAVDKNFQGKEDESFDRNLTGEEKTASRKKAKENKEKNNKQLEAYSALETIYNHQVRGLEKKVQMSTAAEIAYIVAEGFELTDIFSTTATGDTALATSKTEDTAAISAISGPLAALVPSSFLFPCITFNTSVVSYMGALKSYDLAKYAEGNAQLTNKKATSEKQRTNVVKNMTPAGAIFCSTAGSISCFTPGETTVENTEDTVIGTANDSAAIAVKPPRLALFEEMTVLAATCQTAITSCASAVATTATCAPLLPIATTTIPAILTAVAGNEAFRALPILCSGAQTIKGVDYDTPLPGISMVMDKIDQIEPPAEDVPKANIKVYVKNIIQNFFYRITMKKINEKKIVNPRDRVREIAANSKYVEYLTDQTMNKFMKTDFNQLLRKQDFSNPDNFSEFLLSFSKKIKIDLIKSSQAGGGFKELLNIGVKVGVLYYMMSGWVKNNAFPKPMNRAVTWGIMAVVNGAILAFDKNSKEEAEKRLQIVKDEKAMFAASHSLKTEVVLDADEENDEDRTTSQGDLADRSLRGEQILGCAVPKGDSFAPTVCPSLISRKRFNLNRGGQRFAPNGSLLGDSIGTIGDIGYGATSGEAYSNPSLMEAKIATLEKNKTALVKLRDSLRKKVDLLPTGIDKNGKKFKRVSLSGNSSKYKSLFSGGISKTGITNDMANSINSGKLPKMELAKLKALANKNKAKTGLLNIPKFQMPSSSKSDFDFDLDDNGGGISNDDIEVEGVAKGEEDLEEFVVDSGEINENEHVNIFKLISNRYLNSYPILLDEIKKKAK